MMRQDLSGALLGLLLGLLVILVWQWELGWRAATRKIPAGAVQMVPGEEIPDDTCTFTPHGDGFYTWRCTVVLQRQSCDALRDCVEL